MELGRRVRPLPAAPAPRRRGDGSSPRGVAVHVGARGAARPRERARRARRRRAADGHHPPRRDALEHLPVDRRTGEARRLRHRALDQPRDHALRGRAPMLKGKFAYLAPEQVAGEPFDQRADLFATGRRARRDAPRHARSSPAAASSPCCWPSATAASTPPRGASQLPAGLFEVLERALARDPGEPLPDGRRVLRGARALRPEPAARRGPSSARWSAGSSRRPSTEQMQAVRDSGAKIAPPRSRGPRRHPATPP